jgi:hypothetical protein
MLSLAQFHADWASFLSSLHAPNAGSIFSQMHDLLQKYLHISKIFSTFAGES